jgi:hypothetical protein
VSQTEKETADHTNGATDFEGSKPAEVEVKELVASSADANEYGNQEAAVDNTVNNNQGKLPHDEAPASDVNVKGKEL